MAVSDGDTGPSGTASRGPRATDGHHRPRTRTATDRTPDRHPDRPHQERFDDMEPPIDPADHTVATLREAIQSIDDPAALEAVLEAEEAGDNRTTAREAIDERLDEVRTQAGPGAAGEAEASLDDLPTPSETAVSNADADILTVDGPDDDDDLSERLLANLGGIRSTLEDARQAGGRYEARLRKVENEVSDLSAYTAALEDFLEAEGTGQQLIESFRDDIESLEDDVEDIALVVRSHARNLRAHRETIADIEDDLTSQRAGLDRVVDDVEGLEARLEDLGDRVSANREAHGDRLADLESTVDDHGRAIDDVEDAVDAVDESLGALADEVDDRLETAAAERDGTAELVEENAAAIDDLDSRVAGVDSDLADRLDELEADIQSLQNWREQLGSVMAGALGGSNQ